jgi:tetratricopeptide (TPR) repeat protein
MNRRVTTALGTFLSQALVSVTLVMAQPASTCERGPNPGRISACNELLRQTQSPDKLAVIYRNRGQAYSWAGQYDLAVKDLSAALEFDPNDVEALYQRAGDFGKVQEHSRALADANRLIALGDKAKNYAVQQLRCRALAGLGQFEEAIRACSEQLRPYPSQIFLWDRGEVLLLAGQLDRAMEDFDVALKIDKNMIHAILGRGKVLLAKQDYAAAREEFDRANRMSVTTSGQAWGMALSKLGLRMRHLVKRRQRSPTFNRP